MNRSESGGESGGESGSESVIKSTHVGFASQSKQRERDAKDTETPLPSLTPLPETPMD